MTCCSISNDISIVCLSCLDVLVSFSQNHLVIEAKTDDHSGTAIHCSLCSKGQGCEKVKVTTAKIEMKVFTICKTST